MLTPKFFEKWINQSLKLLPGSFYFNVWVKGTRKTTEAPKKLGIVIQACNLSIWEDEGGGTWVWGLLGLHSDTMSQNNNNYKASKAFTAKDVLGTAHRCSPWRHTGPPRQGCVSIRSLKSLQPWTREPAKQTSLGYCKVILVLLGMSFVSRDTLRYLLILLLSLAKRIYEPRVVF